MRAAIYYLIFIFYTDNVAFSLPPKPAFNLVPFDVTNGPTACPPYLLHVNEDGSTFPVELVAGAFDLFEGPASQ